MRDWWRTNNPLNYFEPEAIFIACAAAGILLLLILTVFASIEEAAQWEQFAAENGCRVVSKVSASTGVGTGTVVGANGQVGVGTVTTYTPGKTGYLCNDGVTYWR